MSVQDRRNRGVNCTSSVNTERPQVRTGIVLLRVRSRLPTTILSKTDLLPLMRSILGFTFSISIGISLAVASTGCNANGSERAAARGRGDGDGADRVPVAVADVVRKPMRLELPNIGTG